MGVFRGKFPVFATVLCLASLGAFAQPVDASVKKTRKAKSTPTKNAPPEQYPAIESGGSFPVADDEELASSDEASSDAQASLGAPGELALPPPPPPLEANVAPAAPERPKKPVIPFDQVPRERRDTIRGRLVLVDRLILRFGRAYDYRTHTTAELRAILTELEAAETARLERSGLKVAKAETRAKRSSP
jgi:hypothetical protein